MTDKIKALAKFWDCEIGDIRGSTYQNDLFEIGQCEFLVLDDQEADEKAKEYIEDSLWAFNPSFLSGETGLPEEVFIALQEKCEDANDTIIELLGNKLDDFVENAVSCDGRGHFLPSYDGTENETAEFFIYRMS